MSDSSDSDENVLSRNPRRGIRKKIVMKIEFDDTDDASSIDDSTDVKPSCSSKNFKNKRVLISDDNLSSSDSEHDNNTMDKNNSQKLSIEDNQIDVQKKIFNKTITTNYDSMSDDSSSDESKEKCPICLLSLRQQEIGSPATCDHLFCAICIEEWSKNVTTCPIDRMEFQSIIVHESISNRKFIKEIHIDKQSEPKLMLNDNDITICEICHLSDREDVLLLCDGCNQGYHIDCLTPPLLEIPEGSWYCDHCFENENGDEDLAEELQLLETELENMIPTYSRLRVREVFSPRIPRTRQSERIRANVVARTRTTRFRTPSTTHKRQNRLIKSIKKKQSKRRKYKCKKRKTYVVEYDINSCDEKFGIKTTKKCIRKRRRKCKSRTNRRELAREISPSSSTIQCNRGRSILTSQELSIFGNPNNLEYFSDDSDDTFTISSNSVQSGIPGSLIQTSIRVQSCSSLRRRKGILTNINPPAQNDNPTDILSSILEMQERWHTNNVNQLNNVKIGPNGILTFENKDKSKDINKNSIKDEKNNVSDKNSNNNIIINEAPLYPRSGGNQSFSGRSGGTGGSNNDGNYRNRYNNQTSGYRHSTGSSGTSSLQNRSSTGTPSFAFNTFRRENNLPLDNNVGCNNIPSILRGRFNRNQNQRLLDGRNLNQERLNNNNSNYNSNRFVGFSNNNSTNILNSQNNNYNLSETNINIQPINLPQTYSNLPIRPVLNMNNINDSTGSYGTIQTNISNTNKNYGTERRNYSDSINDNNNITSCINLPVYGPENRIDNNEPTTSTGLSSVIPPLAPPPWNRNLFRLAGDYGDDDDEDEDHDDYNNNKDNNNHSDCPNFSVYSAESFEVARKLEPNESIEKKDNTIKQEDEYEEKQEDLVQLGDDDDIPDAINVNYTFKTEQNEAEISVKNDFDNNENTENKKINEVSQSKIEVENDLDQIELPNPPNLQEINLPADPPKIKQSDTKRKIISDKENEENLKLFKTQNIKKFPLVTQKRIGEQNKLKIVIKNISLKKKGILDLYDDSDLEENCPVKDKTNLKKESESETVINCVSNLSAENNQIEAISPEMILHENDSPRGLTPLPIKSQSPTTPPIVSTSFIEQETDEELKNITTTDQTEAISEEEERSYTPCLDEKTDHDEHMILQAENEIKIEREKIKSELHTTVIDGMETELISDEDEEILNAEQNNIPRKKEEKKTAEITAKKTKTEQFKKISKNTKERNYRDKDRSRSRKSRSKSKYSNRENRNEQRYSQKKRDKRREIERYDVRNIIGHPRAYKDRYGRDTSRPPRSRSPSRSRRLRTTSRSNSLCDKRSFSISPSPLLYKKSSLNRCSTSRQSRHSRSHKRSVSRRRSTIRQRTPLLTKRKTRSPYRVRISRSRSFSRSKSSTPVRHIRPELKRKRRSYTPSSLSPPRSAQVSPERNRSKSFSPIRNKNKKIKDRKTKKRIKKRLLENNPPTLKQLKRSVERSGVSEVKHKKKRRTQSKTPIRKHIWTSPSPNPQITNNNSSWTPPLNVPNSSNLTVVLNNKKSSKPLKKKEKREKKKNLEKRKELAATRKEKRKQQNENHSSPIAPSKEVFASGDNILVSVSFNKESNNQPHHKQTTVVTLPPTREEIITKRRSSERTTSKKHKKNKRRHKKTDVKPVAIIDLERSPFQEINSSPKDIIILTDSEHDERENEDQNDRNNNMENEHVVHTENVLQIKNIETNITVETDIQEDSYEIQQLGPKTPPEPSGKLIKFSLQNKNRQLKTRNALHTVGEQKENEDDMNEEPNEPMNISPLNKIGPNTPPESAPCSPDAYDPFDPTKSPSVTQSPLHPPSPSLQMIENTPVTQDKEKISNESNSSENHFSPAKEKSMNPVDLVMALMTNKPQELCNLNNESVYIPTNPDICEETDNNSENNMAKSITILSNVLISSNKPQQRSTNIPIISSPISTLKSNQPNNNTNIGQNNILKLPLSKPSSIIRHNGNPTLEEAINEIESPYSPGSDDYDDLFEPPTNETNSTTLAQLSSRTRKNKNLQNKNNNKTEIFDNLFGSTSPVIGQMRLPNFNTPGKRHGSKSQKKNSIRVAKLSTSSSRWDEDQIKIVDDVPNSAVELQVKDKFLRKLNRQERVVEEVKLVLKPHYNKKHISKEDYKEILRRAVPKICHSRSGEINPKKIQGLIEAYVKKFRQRNKLGIGIQMGQVSSAVKCAAYLKKL